MKEKGGTGCEGRCVSAFGYQWEDVIAGQVCLRGMSLVPCARQGRQRRLVQSNII